MRSGLAGHQHRHLQRQLHDRRLRRPVGGAEHEERRRRTTRQLLDAGQAQELDEGLLRQPVDALQQRLQLRPEQTHERVARVTGTADPFGNERRRPAKELEEPLERIALAFRAAGAAV